MTPTTRLAVVGALVIGVVLVGGAATLLGGPGAGTTTPTDGSAGTPSTNPTVQPAPTGTPEPPVHGRVLDGCGVIDEPGRYVLTADIASDHERCLTVSASDVVLDGRSHTVRGSGIAGITVTGETQLSNVSVRNVSVGGWDYGIYYEGVVGGTVADVVADENQLDGVRLVRVEETAVRRVSANRNRFGGISLDRATAVLVVDARVRDNTDGVAVTNGSDRTTISRTIAAGNTNQGLFVWDSSDVILGGNTVLASPRAISVIGATDTDIRRNEVSNSVAGVSVQGGESLRVADNVVVENRYGIRVRFTTDASVTGNRVTGSEFHGIDLFAANSTRITNTTVHDSGFDGVNLRRSPGNELVGNDIADNGGDGIVLSFGSDGNHVVANELARNRRGIAVVLSSVGNRIADNTLTANSLGVVVRVPGRNRLTGNHARGGDRGFVVSEATDAVLDGNLASENGIGYVVDQTRPVLETNRAENNGEAVRRESVSEQESTA